MFEKKINATRTGSARLHYHLMLLPATLFLVVFSIVPLFGILIAFENYSPFGGIFGSEWVGLQNFAALFAVSDVRTVFFNTIFIAVLKIIFNFLAQLTFALFLNEMLGTRLKRFVQTAVYFPNFISWVILALILKFILGSEGIVNTIITSLFGHSLPFFSNGSYFIFILVLTDVWKNFGFGAIIFLAAITTISPSLYESAELDGAGRWQKILYITLPSLKSIAILLLTLSIGSILNAGFDQIFNLYNPLVYSVSDILDTYVYRMGLVSLQFSFATAVGLLKSVVSFVLILGSYLLAYKFADYQIF